VLDLSPRYIHIQDVAPRDGLQIEPRQIATHEKIELINALSHAGVPKIETTSFVSPRAVPSMADAEAVLTGIDRVPGVEYAALVPNARGAERALACELDELNLVMSASRTHSQANLRMAPEDSLSEFAKIAAVVRDRVPLNVSISTAFGCPFEGRIAAADVFSLLDRIAALGMERVTLCDTTGVANPAQVFSMSQSVRQRWPSLRLTLHFHDTRGMGLANVLAGIAAGVDRFDASLAGLGGCPFAPGASGNVCSEDVVHMLHEMGFTTGIDLAALLRQAQAMPALVSHDVAGQVAKAGPANRRYPLPATDQSSASCNPP
jgi:hydroxymethylglutaryl-CoA lyase